MLRASIDIGSNSTLLLVADVNNGGVVEKCSESRVTALGKNLDKEQAFSSQSMESTLEALREYREKVLKYDISPESVTVTATEAARIAKNSSDFFNQVKNELQFQVVTISSEGEAYYTGRGVAAKSQCEDSEIVIMDIGGASTELIKFKKEPYQLVSTYSFPIGCVRATDELQQGGFEEKLDEATKDISFKSYSQDQIYCVAGTMTALAGMTKKLKAFSEDAIDESELTIDELSSLCRDIEKSSDSEMLEQFPYLGKRVETIYGGCLVALSFADKLNAKILKISKAGLRYGTLVEDGIHERFRINQ